MARNKDKNGDNKSYLGCSKAFTKSDASCQCTVCGLWAHKTCSGCNDEIYHMIEAQKKATGRSYWACRPCMVYAEGMNHRLRQMEERIEKVEQMSEDTAKNVKTVEARVEALDKAVVDREQETEKAMKNAEINVFEELRERESRKLNIVLHKVGECENDSAEGKEKREWDIASCENILREMKTDYNRDDIKFVRRIGEKSNTVRPLVVGLFTEQSKRKILAGARTLKDTFFKDVQIVPDLTKRQREEEETLRRKADELNGKRTNDEKSKNLEWMVVGQKGEKKLIKAVPRYPQNRRDTNTKEVTLNNKRARMEVEVSDSDTDKSPPHRRCRGGPAEEGGSN